MPFQLPYGL